MYTNSRFIFEIVGTLLWNTITYKLLPVAECQENGEQREIGASQMQAGLLICAAAGFHPWIMLRAPALCLKALVLCVRVFFFLLGNEKSFQAYVRIHLSVCGRRQVSKSLQIKNQASDILCSCKLPTLLSIQI